MNAIRRYTTAALVIAAMGAAACGKQGPAGASAPTAADARQFLDTVNATMKRLDIEGNQAGWVQQNFITDDTEALDARVNQRVIDAIATYRKRGHAVRQASTSPADQRRQLKLLKLVARDGHAVRSQGEREELTTIAARLEGDVRQGQVVRGPGEAGHVPEHRRHHEDHGRVARRGRAARGLGRLAHDLAADAQGLHALRRAVEQGRARARLRGHGAMWRAKYDMPPDEFTQGARSPVGAGAAALLRCTPTCGGSCARSTATRCRRTVRFPRTCSATSGRRTGRTSIRWSRRRTPIPATRSTEILKRAQRAAARDGAVRRALLHVARLRAAAEDVLGALAVRQAEGSRRRVPRQRLGHRPRRRPAHQDVHRA